jgi:hypothetical protein
MEHSAKRRKILTERTSPVEAFSIQRLAFQIMRKAQEGDAAKLPGKSRYR